MGKKYSVLRSAAALTAANIIVKITGLFYKIPIQRLIGDAGMGYFNIAYNIYTWFYILTTAGLPIAVSVCVSRAISCGRRDRCGALFKVSLISFSSVGASFSLIMIVFCRSLAEMSSVRYAYPCIAAIAPAVFFACITASVRGYYQGHGIMWVSAVSLIIEALGKAISGTLLAFYSSRNGAPVFVTAAYAISGVSIGSFASSLFCVTVKSFYKKTQAAREQKEKNVLPELLKTAIPVSASSSVMNLSALIDVFAAPSSLIRTGYTQQQAAEIYGNYSTLCLSFINLPMVFIYPICSAALPAMTAAISDNDRKKADLLARDAIKGALAVTMPCAVGLGVMSYQCLSLVFPFQSAYLAAPMLTALAPYAVLCALLSVSDTMLQACGKASRTLISMTLSAAVKFSSYLLLFRLSFVGRLAIPVGTCLGCLCAVMLNMIFCSYDYGIKRLIPLFIKPAFCASLCGITSYAVYGYLSLYLPDTISAVISIASSAVIYLISIYLSGYLSKDQIKNAIRSKGIKNDGF